jgi:hypothetical protein
MAETDLGAAAGRNVRTDDAAEPRWTRTDRLAPSWRRPRDRQRVSQSGRASTRARRLAKAPTVFFLIAKKDLGAQLSRSIILTVWRSWHWSLDCAP